MQHIPVLVVRHKPLHPLPPQYVFIEPHNEHPKGVNTVVNKVNGFIKY